MTRKPSISTTRAVEVYREMLWWRRQLYDDDTFFKAIDAWEAMRGEIEGCKTKTYRGDKGDEPKAAMIVFGESATLSVDERLIERAKKGHKLSNTLIAHEISHLALDHHARNATTKHFQLSVGAKGKSRIPPDIQELEADLAAVFFQCGVALEDKRMSALELARRSFADVALIEKAQRYVHLDAFQRELLHQQTRYERIVL